MWKDITADKRTQAMIVPGGMIIARIDFQYSETAIPSTAMVFVPCTEGVAKIWLDKRIES